MQTIDFLWWHFQVAGRNFSPPILFPPFLPLCWKASVIQLRGPSSNWGIMYWHDPRGRVSLRATHRYLTASVWDCTRASAPCSMPPFKTVLCYRQSPIQLREQGGHLALLKCHWSFWEVSTGPSSCFTKCLGMSAWRAIAFWSRYFLLSPTEQNNGYPKLTERESMVLLYSMTVLWIPEPIYGWEEFWSHYQEF